MRKLKLFSLALMALFTTSLWAKDVTCVLSIATTTEYNGDAKDGKSKTFVSEGQTFTIAKGSTPGTAGFYGNLLKLSKNATYTIGLPNGFVANSINFKGYTNASSAGSISEVNGDNKKTYEFPTNAVKDSEEEWGDFTTTITGTTGNITVKVANSQQLLVIITITGTAPDCSNPESEFTAATSFADVNEEVSLSFSSLNTSAVAYSIKKGGAATEDASITNGKFSATANGFYVITAAQEADGTYCEVSESVNITVCAPLTGWVAFDGASDVAFRPSPITYNEVSIAYETTSASKVDASTKTLVGTDRIYANAMQISKSTGGYVKFTVPTGYTATFSCVIGGTGNRKIYLGSQAITGTGDGWIATLTEAVTSANLVKISYDTPLTAGDYYICEGGNGNWQIAELVFDLEAVAPLCAATVPGDIAKGTLSAGNLTLTAAGSPEEGDVWYWQDAADGTATDKGTGASKTVNAAGTYYIRSFNATADCWSAAKSIEVVAADLVANYTVVYKDGETELGSEVVAVGGNPEGIADPTKEFYTFAGWEYNNDPVEPTEFDEGEEGQTYDFMAVWTAKYATTADFAAIVNAGTTASNPIDEFSASHNMKITGLNKSAWETETTKPGFIGFKLKDAGAVVKFLAQSGKYVTITLGSVGDNATLNKGGVESTIAKKKGDNEVTVIDTFQPEADMIVSLTTTTAETVTLKKIAITNTDPTALDNTEAGAKAVKSLKNGVLIIEKNGKKYNIIGSEIR